MSTENADGREIKRFVLAITTARTRRGRYMKAATLFVSLISSLLIPMGVLVIYYLWKHGNQILDEQRGAVRQGLSSGEA